MPLTKEQSQARKHVVEDVRTYLDSGRLIPSHVYMDFHPSRNAFSACTVGAMIVALVLRKEPNYPFKDLRREAFALTLGATSFSGVPLMQSVADVTGFTLAEVQAIESLYEGFPAMDNDPTQLRAVAWWKVHSKEDDLPRMLKIIDIIEASGDGPLEIPEVAS